MLTKEIISNLTYFNKKFPKETLLEARNNKEEITEELLESLNYINENAEIMYEDSDENYFLHMYAVFLLSEFKEKRAFPIIIEILQKDKEVVEFLFGDVITEDLDLILASTFNGDIKLLFEVIENVKADEFVRDTTFRTFNILLHNNVIDKKFIIEYINELVNSTLIDDDSYLTTGIATFIAENHFFELIKVVRNLYDDNKVETLAIGYYDDFIDAIYHLVSKARNLNYIEDAVKKMECWSCFDNNEEILNKQLAALRKVEKLLARKTSTLEVERNSPCPRGSGKKYKKCCLNKQAVVTQEDSYIKKSTEHYPKEEVLLTFYDKEAIDIDRNMYIAIKHKVRADWTEDDREEENRMNINFLTTAFELFIKKCEKENIKTFDEYDEKFSIHYMVREFIDAFLCALDEHYLGELYEYEEEFEYSDSYEENQNKKIEILNTILSRFQLYDHEKKYYLLYLLQTYENSENEEKAEEFLKQMIKEYPEKSYAYIELSQFHEDNDEGIEKVLKPIEYVLQTTKSEDMKNDMLIRCVDIYANYGDNDYDADNFEEALQKYNKAWAYAKEYIEKNSVKSLYDYELKTLSEYSLNELVVNIIDVYDILDERYIEEKIHFNIEVLTLIALDEDVEDIFIDSLVEAYTTLGNTKKALEIVDNYIERYPNNPSGYRTKANVYLLEDGKEDYKQAEEILIDCLDNPKLRDKALIYSGLASMCEEMNDFEMLRYYLDLYIKTEIDDDDDDEYILH